jgi:uncharacterized membrane protein (UPF0127 family)
MNRLARWLERLRKSSGSAKSAGEDLRLQMTNLTRRTRIASRVEVADSGAKRSKGLLGRVGLAPGEAIWIVPCESVHTFGMKFAIDLIYLDRHLRIRKIRSNVRPWRISGCLTAHSVVELASGSIRTMDAQVGDLVEFSRADTGAIASGSVLS